jgi:hypothetical protein
MASRKQYQGQGLLDFSEEQESDTVCSSSSPDKMTMESWTHVEKSDLHGSLSVSPGGEKTAIPTDSTASNVEVRIFPRLLPISIPTIPFLGFPSQF